MLDQYRRELIHDGKRYFWAYAVLAAEPLLLIPLLIALLRPEEIGVLGSVEALVRRNFVCRCRCVAAFLGDGLAAVAGDGGRCGAIGGGVDFTAPCAGRASLVCATITGFGRAGGGA